MEILSIEYMLGTFLIFVRVSSLILSAPYFSSAAFPAQVKIFFALITSILLYPVVPAESIVIPADAGFLYVGTTIFIEALIGISFGLVGQLVFAGLEMAGRLISLKIVLGFASVVDTMTQQQSTAISSLFNMLAILVFLAIDGDKIYLNALAQSFEVLPLGEANVHLAGPFMTDIALYIFLIAVQISAPFIVVLFLLDLALAIFARIMPQANIMFIALPIKLGVGFILLYFVAPYLPTAFTMMLQQLFDYLQSLMEILVQW